MKTTPVLNRTILTLLLLVLSTLSTNAQDIGGESSEFDMVGTPLMQQLQQRLTSQSFSTGMLALEGAIDPTEYRVGPGDQFSISMGGPITRETTAQVAADGRLMLLDSGSIEAAGKSLKAVQEDAVNVLREQYRNVPVHVSLSRPRQFYVHVSGAVPRPNRYLAIPVARVSDVLEQAYASRTYELQYLQATSRMAQQTPQQAPPASLDQDAPSVIPSAASERPKLSEDYRPSLRTVQLTRRDGTERTLDLFRYYTAGDIEHNPYVQDGDVLTVPSYHVKRDGIRVSGEVGYPGTYAYRPGDTALDVLLIATGPDELKHVERVRLTRRASDGAVTTKMLDVPALRAGEQPSVEVQRGDHLNVLPGQLATAAIYGMVNYPGTYPIEDGETTLTELLDLAGGLKANANVRAAFLERQNSLTFKEDGRTSDLDFFSRAFLAKSMQNQNHVVIDVDKLLNSEGEDVILRNEDRIVFPRDENTVFVVGNVPQQGYVELVPGQEARYYIEQAGGMGAESKGVYVFEAGTGQVRHGEDTVVRSGDVVFVNREDLAESPELAQLLITEERAKRQNRIMIVQTIISGITAAVAVIATIQR